MHIDRQIDGRQVDRKLDTQIDRYKRQTCRQSDWSKTEIVSERKREIYIYIYIYIYICIYIIYI